MIDFSINGQEQKINKVKENFLRFFILLSFKVCGSLRKSLRTLHFNKFKRFKWFNTANDVVELFELGTEEGLRFKD